MKRNIFKVLIVYVFIAFTVITVNAIRTSSHDIKIKRIELRNTDAQLKNLQLDFDKLNKDLDSEIQNKVKNQQKIDELEKHRLELEKQLQAKKEAASRFASTVTGTKKVYAEPVGDAKAFIYQHESGNNPAAVNSIGCRGLGQACPGSKLPCSNSDYECQDAWFTNYMVQRYGTWENARAFWLNNHWW
jgi:hypothetical protein